ncbi:MAG: glycosyltransferase family 2 protein [Candidatus Portnoybacteria bacterium CG10_big_fil_rev_8_21_14_0_10_44_7]|uniref:Glycosyltransferase family 2 protein n=1 Tax=Candidatus Portnoybacteria bacterium CG10_big_fil_rev_8_21_14_0_10_44_7 TaxID=1974816 RepID=A0A2M8KIC0_9BACT|nr:MAG: glycosyltransferase family 2 protein [Candidatus Portnoybacteria bacterium CG10_big_fil_rev_8_21_14_0_10_44_7]
MRQPKVGIIIVNYKDIYDILATLDSLKKLQYPNFEIFVTDNASQEHTEKALRQKQKEINFHLIIEKGNPGFAGGNNLAIREAQKSGCDDFCLLNLDTSVEPDFLGRLVAVAQSDNRVGILGPRINYFFDPGLLWFNGGQTNWLKTAGQHQNLDEPESGVAGDNQPREVDFITGCTMYIRGQVVKKIGLLSEDYFMYHEDVDYCLRAKKAGFRIVFVPEAKIYHKISKTTKPGSETYIYYHTRNGLMTGWRYNGFFGRLTLIIFSILRLGKQVPKFFSAEKRKWARGVIFGTLDFYLSKKGKTRLF